MVSLSSSPLSSAVHPPSLNRNKNSADRPSPFHPSVWGDFFLSYNEDHKKIDAWTRRAGELKEEVKKMLIRAKGSVEEMIMIDEIQRLGVAYHFEKEINDALEHINDANVDYEDLKTVALRFRLLREEGYDVSSDVLNKFKDKEGNFKKGLSSDVEGLLSLYEAAFYGTHGEDILDEAISFTKAHLSSLVTHLDGPLGAQVGHALELPMRKRIARLDARFYISLFQQHKQPNEIFLELAKLDFNLAQSMYGTELKELTRWWKDIGLTAKYPYARDRLVEGYLWILSIYVEPQYARARNMAVKIFKLISITDDTFDVDGKFEDLKVFSEAFQRWDLSAMDQLPEYMRPIYHAVLNTINEIEKELLPREKFFRTDLLKHEVEQKGPHVASAIESYMKEHGVSRLVACKKIREMVTAAWKDMNKFCLKPTLFPLSLLKRVVNIASMNEVIYLHGDGYTDSSREIKEMIRLLFVDPIPL